MLCCLYTCYEGVLGSRGVTPHILNLGISCVVSFTRRPLYSRGNSPKGFVEFRAGRVPWPASTFWRRKKYLPLQGIKPRFPDHPVYSIHRHCYLGTSSSLLTPCLPNPCFNCSKINTNKMTLMDYPLFHG